MRKISLIITITLLLFQCDDRELKTVKELDFDILVNFTEEFIPVNEAFEFDFDIVFENSEAINEALVTLTYPDSVGELVRGGAIFSSGEKMTVGNIWNFIPRVTGEQQLILRLEDNFGNVKEETISLFVYDPTEPPTGKMTLTVNEPKEAIAIGFLYDFTVEFVSEDPRAGNTTFTTSYTVSGDKGIVRDENGIFLNQNAIIQNKVPTQYSFDAEDEGSITVTFNIQTPQGIILATQQFVINAIDNEAPIATAEFDYNVFTSTRNDCELQSFTPPFGFEFFYKVCAFDIEVLVSGSDANEDLGDELVAYEIIFETANDLSIDDIIVTGSISGGQTFAYLRENDNITGNLEKGGMYFGKSSNSTTCSYSHFNTDITGGTTYYAGVGPGSVVRVRVQDSFGLWSDYTPYALPDDILDCDQFFN